MCCGLLSDLFVAAQFFCIVTIYYSNTSQYHYYFGLFIRVFFFFVGSCFFGPSFGPRPFCGTCFLFFRNIFLVSLWSLRLQNGRESCGREKPEENKRKSTHPHPPPPPHTHTRVKARRRVETKTWKKKNSGEEENNTKHDNNNNMSKKNDDEDEKNLKKIGKRTAPLTTMMFFMCSIIDRMIICIY